VNEDANHAQGQKGEDVPEAGNELQPVRGIDDDGGGGTGIDEAPQVHLAQGDDEAGVDGEHEEEIEFAGANEFGEVGAVDEEEGLENLLDELAGADEEDDLPFGPGADGVGVEVNDADEGELQTWNEGIQARIFCRLEGEKRLIPSFK